MASQAFNARGGLSVGITGTSVVSETGNVTGLLGTFTSGISASGATFTGNISAPNIVNIVTSFNGLTGAVAGIVGPVGVTSGSFTQFTFPNGVTATNSKRPWYQSSFHIGRSVATGTVVANRTYFILNNAPRGISLTSIRSSYNAGAGGITGEAYYSVWDVDPVSGLPGNRLYVSSSQILIDNYGKVAVTNSAGLVRVNAGLFYTAITFSKTPPMVSHSSDRMIHAWGSGDNLADGYMNYIPVLQTSGYTAPSSINQAGTTFAFVSYYPTTVPIPLLEWQATY